MRPNVLQRFCKVALSLALLFIPLILFAGPPAGVLDASHASVRAVIAVQNEVTADWMRQPGVLGTAVGIDANGTPVLTVYIDRDAANAGEVIRNLPRELRGIDVQVELTDKFRAMARPGSGVSHTATQTPPIQLGTSGGWSKDLANGYCCGGTLGSLVQIGGKQYILSNYHVLESDIVPGGNNIVAATGDPIIQPGLIDVRCSASGAQSVATLVKKSSLPNSNVDCSIGKVVAGKVASNGSILEIGTISKTTLAAAIGQAVKKSGRTTGLSRNSIVGLNATINVA